MKLGVIKTWQAPRCQAAGECEVSWEGASVTGVPRRRVQGSISGGEQPEHDEGV